jgi:hypothetical protein
MEEAKLGGGMAAKKYEAIAKRYLRDQAKIMTKYGETPKLSGKRYEAAVQSAARTFETIASSK